ncbi:MAG: hypothetical protein HY749_00220 [Gammaproteobacteria bacterium]|nr:hypothetical protein [Gammaproteobacteria bacterium]
MPDSNRRRGELLRAAGLVVTAVSLLLLATIFVDWAEWTKDVKATVFGNTLPVFAVVGIVAGLFLVLVGQNAIDGE